LFIIIIIRKRKGRRGAEQNLRLVIIIIPRKGLLVLSITKSIPSNIINKPILLVRIKVNIVLRPYRYKPRYSRNRFVICVYKILVV
jgi:hypothetical protein